jgi:hypothetical protein
MKLIADINNELENFDKVDRSFTKVKPEFESKYDDDTHLQKQAEFKTGDRIK